MNSKQIRIVSLLVFLTSIPMVVGDKLVKIPGLPGWLTSLWPAVVILAPIINHALHIYFDPVLPPAAPVTPNLATKPDPFSGQKPKV